PLTIRAAHVAVSAGDGSIVPNTDSVLTFQRRSSVTIPAGAPMLSDPLEFDLAPLSDLAVTVRLTGAPVDVTTHPGARATSYLQAGDAVSARDLPHASRVDHWYFLSGVDVLADGSSHAIVALG